MDNSENYPLDETAIQFIAEIDAEITKLQERQAGGLQYFLRLHKLTGPWRVAQNRRELVKASETIPASQ